MTDCTYCGCEVEAHDPVFVSEGSADDDPASQFCNYACLSAHVEESGLAEGSRCRLDALDSDG